MNMKPEHQRVRTLLTDTVSLLCKSGLAYNRELKVQGLLGITVDDEEVFIVHINEKYSDTTNSTISMHADTTETGPTLTANEDEPSPTLPQRLGQSGRRTLLSYSQKAHSPRAGHRFSSHKFSPKRASGGCKRPRSTSTHSASEPPVKVKREPDTDEQDVILLGDCEEDNTETSATEASQQEPYQYSGSLSFSDVQSGIPGLEENVRLPTSRKHSQSDYSNEAQSFDAGIVKQQFKDGTDFAHGNSSWNPGSAQFEGSMEPGTSSWEGSFQGSLPEGGGSSLQQEEGAGQSSETVGIILS